MELSLISSSHADTDTECLVIGVSESNSVVGSATELDTLISELIDSIIEPIIHKVMYKIYPYILIL